MKIPIAIPEDSDILIQEGDTVDYSTPFIKNGKIEEIKISLASNLGFDPDKIFMYLHKFVGDPVKKDELLAEKKAFLSSQQYYSEFEGSIKEINHYDGSVTIVSKLEESAEISCYFQGKVSAIDTKTLLLEVKHGKEYALREKAPPFGGRVLYFQNTQQITEELVNNTVVMADSLTPFDMVKLEALGASGFVLLQQPDDEPTMPFAVFKQIQEYEHALKQQFSSCIIGADSTTIYFYD